MCQSFGYVLQAAQAKVASKLTPFRLGCQCEPSQLIHAAVAMQESEVQAEYDHVLREAKLLRLDFQHALTNCVEHKVGESQYSYSMGLSAYCDTASLSKRTACVLQPAACAPSMLAVASC